MELLRSFVELIGHIAWPIVTLVIIFKFAPAAEVIISNIVGHLSPGRNIRARIGNIEIESNCVPIKREELEQIVAETDPAKRLELFKKRFDLENVIKQIDDRDLEWLRKFAIDYNIPNAFLVWPWGNDAREEAESYLRLEKLGLVKAYPNYLSGGEWIGMVTDNGKEILQLLITKQSDDNSKAEQIAATNSAVHHQ